MSTATKTSQYVEFDEYIDFQLQKTRQSMKVTDIATAFGGVVVGVLAYLLIFAVCDHWLIPGGFGDVWRVMLLAGLVVGTCLWVGIKVVRPSLRRVNQLYAARAIEGVSPDLQSNLINWVDLRHAGREISPLILRSIEKRAAVSLSHADVDEAVDRQTLLKVLYALVAVVFLFAAYVVISPKKVGPSIWRALLPTSEVQVATRTQIEKVDPPGTEVPAGSVLEITTDLLGDIPPQVTLKYSTADRRVVDRAVEMRLLEDGLKRYRCLLDGERGEGLLQDLDFWIEAGDAQSPSYHVTVIQPPSATITEVAYDFPKYTLKEREAQPSANIDTLEGTTVTITATTNMPVKSAVLQFSDDDKFAAKGEEKVVRVSDGVRLSVDWKAEFRNDGSFPKFYRLQVRTESGLFDPSPAVHSILLRRDVPPEIELVAPQVNMSLFANAIVPIVVKARDPDFLLRDVQLFATKKEQQIFDKVLADQRISETEVRFDWRLADLNLQPGDEVTMYVAARDNKEPFANRKESQRRVITITEPGTQKQVEEQLAKDQQKIDEIQQTERPNDGRRDENDPGTENPNADPQPGTEPRDTEKTDPEKQPRDGKPDKQRQPQDGKGHEDGDPSNEKSAPSNSGKKSDSNQNDSADDSKNDPSKSPESDPNAKKNGRRDAQPNDKADSNNDGSPDDSKTERRPLKNDGSDDVDALKTAIERLKEKPSEQPPQPGSQQNGATEKQPQDESSQDTKQPEPAKNNGGDNKNNQTEKPTGNDSTTKPDGTKPETMKPEQPTQGDRKDDSQKPGDSTKSDSTDNKNDGSKSLDKQPMPSQSDKKDPQTGAVPKNDAGQPMTDSKTNDTKGKDNAQDKADSPSKNPGQSTDNPDKANGSKTQPMTTEPMPKTGNSSQDPKSKDDKQPSTGKSQDSNEVSQTGSSKTEDSKTQPRPSNEPKSKDPSQNKANNNEPKNSDTANSKSSSQDRTNDNKKPKDSGSTSAADCPDPQDGDNGSNSKPPKNGKQPAQTSEKNADGKPSDEKSEDKSGATQKSDDNNAMKKGRMQTDEQQPSGPEKDDAQKGADDDKKGNADSKSKDPMKANGPKNEGEKKDGAQSSEKKSDNGPKGGKSASQEPGKDGGESEAKDGEGTAKSKDGNKPSTGKPGKLQSRDGPADGQSGGADGATEANPDPVNLDDKKKATDLVLKRLKDELERGEVDQEFLKQLGWTESDLQRFVDRLDQQSKASGDTPAEQVRRRQFEEMLKSLDLRSSGGTREDVTKKKRSTSDFADKQVPVPLEYRDAYKKYADKLSKQKKPDAK